jgi:hypothetical protein
MGHLYSLDGATSGSQVACSQRIGTVGKSGNADEKTGVHLHFGLKVKDTITGVWENRDPYGSPKNTNGSSCPGYTGPAYPSYWYKMENGSTERPSIQCQSTKPLATSLINVQKHESQNYTYLEIEDNYSSNLVDLSFVQFSVERKFNNGPWANPLPQELNNVTGSTTKIFSLPGGPVVEQGNYCYRVRAYSPATKEYSSFSNEKCIQITGDNVATNSSLDQKPNY